MVNGYMSMASHTHLIGIYIVGVIAKKVQERILKWYGYVMRREEHYVGRRTMGMQVQGRRKGGRTKRRGMISKRRECWGRKCTTVLHGGICHHTSTDRPHLKVGIR